MTTAGSLEFQCEHSECGKTFQGRYHLEVHQNIHRNNLQKCFFCPWAGIVKADISTHHDKHFLNPTYQCSDCGRKFYRKKNRDMHFESQHENIEKKYSCKLCSYKTHSQILLKRHVKRQH